MIKAIAKVGLAILTPKIWYTWRNSGPRSGTWRNSILPNESNSNRTKFQLILLVLPKGLATFTQLVKVRRGKLVLALAGIQFSFHFTRSSLALNMSRKLCIFVWNAPKGSKFSGTERLTKKFTFSPISVCFFCKESIFLARQSIFAYSMSHIFWKLIIWRLIWYICRPSMCILWQVRSFVTLWIATSSISWNLVIVFLEESTLENYHPDQRRKIQKHQHHHIVIDCPLLYRCMCSCPQSPHTFFAPSWVITLIKRLSW